MISRRKVFAWLSGLIGGAVVAPSVMASTANATVAEAVEFPGNLVGADFTVMQQWFRDHPNLLWATPHQNGCEIVRQRAVELSQPFHAKNPHIEYSAWVDHTTDNVLVKTYSRNKAEGTECGLAYAITRKCMRDEPNMDAHITEMLEALTEATNQRPLPPEWVKTEGAAYKRIMGLAEAKTMNAA